MMRFASGIDPGPRPIRPHVHMTGSEWMSARPGGLNRYFSDLYNAMRSRTDIDVTAVAFGHPERGGQSWGPVGQSTMSRVASAFLNDQVPREAIVDRHFCLYGSTPIRAHGKHPLVIHFHGPWSAESQLAGAGGFTANAKFWIERLRYSNADRFVVLSSHFRDLLADTYRVPEHKVAVIPPGVDLARFRVAEQQRTRPLVLCVRRLERRMGIHILIESWRAVAAVHPDARLVIVGTGTVEGELRTQAAASGLTDSISFEGRTSDEHLRDLYEQAAFTVVPTVALEGFGLITLESLAVGRAPIVTDCGGLPDAVSGLDRSLIVEAGDPEALSTRIVAALDGKLPGPQQCRQHAELFSWRTAADRHYDLYCELLK